MTKKIINTNSPDDLINVGNSANDRRGDSLRAAFIKLNDAVDKIDLNFTELYNAVGSGGSGGGGISINDFGDGFSLTSADKIVTNKLYSTNQTNANQHYRLTLDTNGVVVLPDQSIINGATLRVVPGTGELNYAALAAGPNADHPEDTWMWVDYTGAHIGVNYSSSPITWHFNNDGHFVFAGGSKHYDQTGGSNILNHTVEVNNNTWKFERDGTLRFPNSETLVSSENQLYFHKEDIDGYFSEIVLQPGDVGLVSGKGGDNASSIVSINQNTVNVSITDASANLKRWQFRSDAVLTMPDSLPRSFTAVFDGAHMVNAIGFVEGPFWETTVSFTRETSGDVNVSVDNIFPTLSMPTPPYQDGYTFRFTTEDHGIPNYTLEVVLDNIQLPGGAGWTANWLFSLASPNLPELIFSDGLTVSNLGRKSIVGKSNYETITQEDLNGIITQTTTVASQAEITTADIVIGSQQSVVVNDGITTATDSVGSKLEVGLTSMKMETYTDPDGPNNTQYGRVSTGVGTAGLSAYQEEVAGTIGAELTVSTTGIQILQGDGVVSNTLEFGNDGLRISTDLHFGPNISYTGTNSTQVLGGATTTIFTAPSWVSSVKLVISVEGRLDGDSANTDHTQTCEATVAASYNVNTEPVMSVYGSVYTSPTPLATFSVRRDSSNTILVDAINSQTSKTLYIKVASIQFVSIFD